MTRSLVALPVVLTLTACCVAQIGTPPPGYAVVVSKATMQDADWMNVVNALAKRHDAKVIPFEGAVKMARAGLTPPPGRVAFVLRSSEVGKETLESIHSLTRSLDDDPYVDTCWGLITGATAKDALAQVAAASGASAPGRPFAFDLATFAQRQGEGSPSRGANVHRGDPGAPLLRAEPWVAGLSRSGDVWTLSVSATTSCKPAGRVMYWFPCRVASARLLEGGEHRPLITDSFVLLRGVDTLDAGQKVVVRFNAAALKADASVASGAGSVDFLPLPPRRPGTGVGLTRIVDVILGKQGMRARVLETLGRARANRPELEDAFARCPDDHLPGLTWLVASMPQSDLQAVSCAFLLDNVAHAYRAWNSAPWKFDVPEEMFFDHVLPYANVNEKRDPWRGDFYQRFKHVLETARTPTDAMARLNVEAFKTFGVSYHPSKRPKPDQSPSESIAAGYASCTGLSIMLIDACRAIGVPARFVGTPKWTTVNGNHSWVEVFDREWLVIGACEPGTPNRTWFMGRAAKANPESVNNRIYAVDWQGGDRSFPLVWSRRWKQVNAIDVTPFYTRRRAVTVKVRTSAGEELRAVTLRHRGRVVAHLVNGDPGPVTLAGDTSFDAEILLVRKGKSCRVRSRVATSDAALQDLTIGLR